MHQLLNQEVFTSPPPTIQLESPSKNAPPDDFGGMVAWASIPTSIFLSVGRLTSVSPSFSPPPFCFPVLNLSRSCPPSLFSHSTVFFLEGKNVQKNGLEIATYILFNKIHKTQRKVNLASKISGDYCFQLIVALRYNQF